MVYFIGDNMVCQHPQAFILNLTWSERIIELKYAQALWMRTTKIAQLRLRRGEIIFFSHFYELQRFTFNMKIVYYILRWVK
jgi:hypothetical protein